MIFDQNWAIYTVFYKESESEVKQTEILDPGGEKLQVRNHDRRTGLQGDNRGQLYT